MQTQRRIGGCKVIQSASIDRHSAAAGGVEGRGVRGDQGAGADGRDSGVAVQTREGQDASSRLGQTAAAHGTGEGERSGGNVGGERFGAGDVHESGQRVVADGGVFESAGVVDEQGVIEGGGRPVQRAKAEFRRGSVDANRLHESRDGAGCAAATSAQDRNRATHHTQERLIKIVK